MKNDINQVNNNSEVMFITNSEFIDLHYPPLSNINNNINYLKDFFTNENITSVDKIKVLDNPTNVTVVYDELNKSLKNTKEKYFILYIAGHGIRSLKMNNLLFPINSTKNEIFEGTSLEYIKIAEILNRYENLLKIIIIDTCFSGRTTEVMGIYDDTKIKGSLMICSVDGKNVTGAKDKDDIYTAFTGIIIDIFNEWKNSGKEELLFDEIIEKIESKTKSYGLPDPRIVSDYTKSNRIYIKRKKKLGDSSMQYNSKSDMKVLLVKPRVKHPIKNEAFGVPLGLWVLKDTLEKQGYEVDILDERLAQKIGMRQNIDELIEKYDVVGASMCTAEVPPGLEILKKAKNKDKKTVCGGIFSYSNERFLLSHEQIDFVIPGVATKPLIELLKNIRNNNEKPIHGIFSRKSFEKPDSLKNNTWMPDTIPYFGIPLYEKIYNQYSNHLNGKFDILTSRGCTHTCKFCSIQKECHSLRTRDAIEVIKDIVFLGRKGFKRISIKDENFTSFYSRSINIIKKANSILSNEGIEVEFKIKSRLDALYNKEIIDELKQNNIVEIQTGIETLDNTMHKTLLKGYVNLSKKRIKETIKRITDQNIVLNTSYILGINGEHSDYYEQLIEFVKSNYNENIKIYMNFLTPHPVNGIINSNYGGYVLNNDLNCYNHKTPIFCPSTLKTRNSREDMLTAYDEIVDTSSSQEYNPPIRDEIRKQFLRNRPIDVRLQPIT